MIIMICQITFVSVVIHNGFDNFWAIFVTFILVYPSGQRN